MISKTIGLIGVHNIFRQTHMLRYCYSMSFEGSINGGPFLETPWNHREDSCLRNRFFEACKVSLSNGFLLEQIHKGKNQFFPWLICVSEWLKLGICPAWWWVEGASRHTLIPKSRQTEFSSKADFEIHPVFSICSPPLPHLPHLPKASEQLQDFGRFRCRHSAACFRFNLQQLPTAWVCGSIFSLISPFPEVVRIPHLPLTSGNLLLKHCQVPAFEATSCNFSQAESSWVENWYIVVLYLVGTRAKEIKRVFSSQTTCWI